MIMPTGGWGQISRERIPMLANTSQFQKAYPISGSIFLVIYKLEAIFRNSFIILSTIDQIPK